MTAMVIIIACALFLFALPIVEGYLIKRTSVDRDRMIDLASQMMGSPKYTEEQKDFISELLDTALDRRFMVKVVIYLPVYVYKKLCGKVATPPLFVDENFNEFVRLHSKSVNAANPMFAIIFRIEIAVIAILLGFMVTTLIGALVVRKVAHMESVLLGGKSNKLNHI